MINTRPAHWNYQMVSKILRPAHWLKKARPWREYCDTRDTPLSWNWEYCNIARITPWELYPARILHDLRDQRTGFVKWSLKSCDTSHWLKRARPWREYYATRDTPHSWNWEYCSIARITPWELYPTRILHDSRDMYAHPVSHTWPSKTDLSITLCNWSFCHRLCLWKDITIKLHHHD